MSLEGGREGREGRGGERRGGREVGDGGGRGGMTVTHIILMAPYIQTNTEELYLYNNDVTYYVITRNYQWTPEILTNNLLEAGCTTSCVHSSIK